MKRYFPDPVLTKAASELQAREYIEHMDSVIEARGKEIEHLQGLIKDLRAAPIMEQLTQELSRRFPKKLFVDLETGVVSEQPEISDEEILSQGELYLRNMNERKLDKGTLPSAHGDKTILASELSKLPETEVPKLTKAWMKFQQGEDAVAAMIYPPFTRVNLNPEFLKKNICESCSFNPGLKDNPNTDKYNPDYHPV